MEYTLSAFERVGGTVAGAFWMVTREGYEKAAAWQEKWGAVVKPNDPMLYGRDWYVDANARKIGLRTYDPYNYMIREWAPTQTHNLSVNGKDGKTDYNLSFGYLDQSGINKPAKIDDFKRYNGSVRVGTNVSDKLRVYTGAMFSKRDKRYAYATNSTTADPWLYLYRWGPTYPMTTEDGDPVRSPASEMAAANTAFQEYNYMSLNGGLIFSPLKDWNINFDYTHANQEYITKRPGTRFTARDSWSAPVIKNDQWNTINLYTTYDMNINEVHKLKYMLGINRVGYKNAYNWSQTTQLIDYTNPQFDLATGTMTTSGGEY